MNKKHVVSVSLGTSQRNKREEVEFLGQPFLIERIGVDGDLKKFQQTFADLDGKVDAIGIGGADLYVATGSRKYEFRQIAQLVSIAKQTPVVDGSGLKHTLERSTIEWLSSHKVFDFPNTKVLLVSAVDRFGMAQALVNAGAQVVFGDFLFGLGLPIPVRSYRQVDGLGRLLLPIITRCPIQWFYPTGAKQEARTPKFEKYFWEADLICGDWHYIRRFMPSQLKGKSILTQTLRKSDLEFLKGAGVRQAITTTPLVNGESFATNVMEAVIVASLEKREVSDTEMLQVLAQLNWQPNVIPLND